MTESNSEQPSVQPTESGGIGNYINGVRNEAKKITWADRPTAIRLTTIVLATTLISGLVLYLFDYIFSSGLKALINAFLGI